MRRLLPLSLALLLPLTAAADFVTSGLSLATKRDRKACVGDTAYCWTADDANSFAGAAADLRTHTLSVEGRTTAMEGRADALEAHTSGHVNVRSYLPAGYVDGVTDATSAFVAAIASGAKAILVPRGVFRITSTIYVPDGVRIFGHGKYNSILWGNLPGGNGDFYFRTDTPGTANQRVYVKSAGAWVGIL